MCERIGILNDIVPIIKFHSNKKLISSYNLFKCKILFFKDEKELKLIRNSLIIVDGYTFNLKYLNKLNLLDNKIIFIADVHERVPDCEILINHLPWKKESDYNQFKINNFLLGPKFAILRSSFLKKSSNPKGRYLISLGLSNVSEEITKVYNALKDLNISDEMIDIVYDKRIKNIPLKFLNNLNSEEMFKVICNAEYTFITPGNISYEVFSVARKTIMGYVSESQKAALFEFEKLGLCKSVGSWVDADFKKIKYWLKESKNCIKRQKEYFVDLKKNTLKNKVKQILSI